MLDTYLKDPVAEMPVMLRDYLIAQDIERRIRHVNDKNIFSEPYGFLGVVMQAKKYGINIVPFETQSSYISMLEEKGDADHRCLMMNYSAAKKIAQHQQHDPGKYIVFCGNKHINNTISGVPGLSEITGAPTLIVEDISRLNVKTISVNNTKHVAQPNVLIVMDHELNEEAKLFKTQPEQWKTTISRSSTYTIQKEFNKLPITQNIVDTKLKTEPELMVDEKKTNQRTEVESTQSADKQQSTKYESNPTIHPTTKYKT